MMQKDFWLNSTIAVIGGGSWGTVLGNLAAANCREVRLWSRDEDSIRSINTTRTNPPYSGDLLLSERLHAYRSLERVFEGEVHAVLWVLPSSACRSVAKDCASFLKGDELILHATKGIENGGGSLKRISEILVEELPCRRIGVISGPNLSTEIARGEPAATVVASQFSEVREAGKFLLNNPSFRVYEEKDVIGVEWAGALKNILAIAAGAVDAMKLGWNARAMLMTRGLAEMVRFGAVMGAVETTFLGLAGIGDLLATCSSPLSRNYLVGYHLAKGESLEKVLNELGRTAEGVRTTRSVWEFAAHHQISMPITEGVFLLLKGERQSQDILSALMMRGVTHPRT